MRLARVIDSVKQIYAKPPTRLTHSGKKGITANMIGRFHDPGLTEVNASLMRPARLSRLAKFSREATILVAVAAVIALGVGLYLWRPAALFALLPYAFFALCPLSMWLMMRSMNSSNDKKG